MIQLSHVVWIALPFVVLVAVLLTCGRCKKKKKNQQQQQPQPMNVQPPVVVIPRQSSPPQSDASSSEEEKMWENLRKEFLKSEIKKTSEREAIARQVKIMSSADADNKGKAGRKSVESLTDSPQMESYSLPEEESNGSAVVKSASEDLEDQEESTITPTKTYYSFHHCH